jgi:hypothetical protein
VEGRTIEIEVKGKMNVWLGARGEYDWNREDGTLQMSGPSWLSKISSLRIAMMLKTVLLLPQNCAELH